MELLRNLKETIADWLRHNKVEFILLVGVILVAAFLRLWRIDEYLRFLGDEGRDVRVVRRFLTEFDLMFVGPRTSIGDMYLGPLFYYLIAPSLFFANFSPVGPAAFVAILDTVTASLVWFIGREWSGKIAGLGAAFLYAVSPVVIEHARHSWNPNIMPFFAFLSIYAIWSVWRKNKLKWLLVLGVVFAFVLQSHYLGLLLLPTIGIFWLITWYKLSRSAAPQPKKELRDLFKYSVLSFLIFAILMLPLIVFDAKHGWRNIEAMKIFFTHRQTTISAKPWNALPNLWPIWQEHVVTRLLTAKNSLWGSWLAPALFVLVLVILARYYFGKNYKPKFYALSLIIVWIGVGLVGLGLYKQTIFDHYFGFMFAAPFLLVGMVLQEFWRGKIKWLMLLLLGVLLWINLSENPSRHSPQRQLLRTQEVDRKIVAESGGKPFNIALIADNNYEEGYLYFLELWNEPVKLIHPERIEETLTEQLFVVCEDPKKPDKPDFCNPINHPRVEIANFGWARIEQEWELAGVKLFKLIHTKNEAKTR